MKATKGIIDAFMEATVRECHPMDEIGTRIQAALDAAESEAGMTDRVDHPPHYTNHPSGVECITVTEHMSFLRGNAMKYLWRAGSKGSELEDLKKARWYLDREIRNLETSGEDIAL